MSKGLIASGLIAALALLAVGCAIRDRNTEETGIGTNQTQTPTKKPELVPKERVDNWEAKEDVFSKEPKILSVMPGEAEPIRISFSEDEKKEEWDSYLGGADADFATAQIENAPQGAAGRIIEEYNSWVLGSVETELTEGRARWELYHASDPDAFIALTPRIGMKLCRADNSIISSVRSIYRYNREYEPSDYFFYSQTFDASSGLKLSLADLITDPEKMADLICDALVCANASYPEKTTAVFKEQAFRQRVLESIKGERDDGRFAWAISTTGFEFYLSDPFMASEYLVHTTEHAYVPFSLCSDFMRCDLTVPYDYICPIDYNYVAQIYLLSEKLKEEQEKGYYAAYLVQKDQKRYLYLSETSETLVYAAEEKPEFIKKAFGGIYDQISSVYETMPDPEGFTVSAEASLIRELLDLRAEAFVGDDGVPVTKELFHEEYNVEPMSVYKPFEAEVFSDENDEQPESKELAKNTWLTFLRTDGETFIDMQTEGGPEICRLYITGNDEDGLLVNGHPVKEYLNLEGWLEE